MIMSGTMIYKWTRMVAIVALVAGSTAACHYKAGFQYQEEDKSPGADSGNRRIVTTAMPADSATTEMTPQTPSGATAETRPAANAPAVGSSATANGPNAAASASPATKPVTKAKFAHGRASVTAPKIYGTADVAPQFPGGQRGLDNYINKSVNYPQQAIDDDVSGVVHVSFVVDENGHVTKAKVLDASKPADGLDREALRVVNSMPSWIPGKVKGHKVRTRMELPISFVLES